MKKKISLYLDHSCHNLCEYCNANKNIKKQISEEDIKKYIEMNKFDIDFTSIELLGGEPGLIYSKDFIEYLDGIFHEVIITTSCVNEILVEFANYENVYFNISYNDFISMEILEKISHKIIKFSYVLDRNKENTLYEVIKKLSIYDKMILINPVIPTKNESWIYDEKILLEEFKKIWKEHLELNLLNWKRVFECKSIDDPNECLQTNISILPNGDITSCSHESPFYVSHSDIIYGNINTPLSDLKLERPYIKEVIETEAFKKCQECKKCHNANCHSKIYESSFDNYFNNVCQFNQLFWDYAENYAYNFKHNDITIMLTEQCNMKCKYCFEMDFKNRIGNISKENLKIGLDHIFSHDITEFKKITLFGGEPTLNLDGIEYVVKYLENLSKDNDINVLIDINTNGLVVTDRLIELYKRILKIGQLYLSVSLDGYKETNDVNRIDLNNNGTYDRIISNVRKLNKTLRDGSVCPRKLTICKHSVINKETIMKIEEIILKNKDEFDEGLWDSMSATLVTPQKGPTTLFNIDELKYYNTIKEKYTNIFKGTKYEKPFEEITSFYGVSVLSETIAFDPGISICNVIDNNISIRANGDVIPCHAYLDKIDDEDYSDLVLTTADKLKDFKMTIRNPFFITMFKDRFLKMGLLEVVSEFGYSCKECPARLYCHTCLANSTLKGNKIIKPGEECLRSMDIFKIMSDYYSNQLDQDIEKMEKEIDDKINFIQSGLETEHVIAKGNSENILKIIEILQGINNAKTKKD